jgi:hypothetical protein
VPSKQVKANTLPATNLRASSAVIIPASAGMIRDGLQHKTRKHAYRSNPEQATRLYPLLTKSPRQGRRPRSPG